MGMEFRIFLSCAVALCTSSLVQGQGQVELIYGFPTNGYIVPDTLMKIGGLSRGVGSFEVVNYDAVHRSIFMKAYLQNMNGNIDLATSGMIDLNIGETKDVTATVENVDVELLSSACDQDRAYALNIDILDIDMITVVNSFTVGNLNLLCEEPEIYVSIFCPFGVSIQPTVRQNLSEICNGAISAQINGPVDMPGEGWFVKTDNSERDLPYLHFDPSHASDISMAVAGLEVELPARACDNKEVKLNVTLSDGIVEATGWVEVVALCSYDGVNMNIAKGAVGTGPFYVNDGDLYDSINTMDFFITKSGILPDLVYTDLDDQIQPGKYFVTMFITDRPESTITPATCQDNWHIMEPMPWDTIVASQTFTAGADLSAIRWNLLQKVNGKRFKQLCGVKTLVVLVDSIKSMTDEDPCDNFLTYSTEFYCDPATVVNDTLETVFNPYSEDEYVLVYRSKNGSRAYMVESDGVMKQFRPLSAQGTNFSTDVHGYTRLAIVQNYLNETLPAKCDAMDTTALVGDLQTLKDGGDEEMKDLNASSIDNVNMYLNEMRTMKSTGMDLSSMIATVGSSWTADLMTVRDHYDEEVLNGAYEALNDIATGMYTQTVGRMCDIVGQVDMLKMGSSPDPALVRETAYMWVNSTFNGNMECSKNILASVLDYSRSYNVMMPGMNLKTLAVLYKSDSKGPLACYDDSTCMKKMRTICSMDHVMEKEEKPVEEDKNSACMAYEMTKFFKEQGNAMAFMDIRKHEAEDISFEPTGCLKSNKIEVRSGPVRLQRIKDGKVQSGVVLMDSSNVAWTADAVLDCQVCNNPGWGGSGMSTGGWNWSGSGGWTYSGSGSGWTTPSGSGGWTSSGSGSGWPTAGSGWTTAGSGGWPTAGSGGWTTAGSGGWPTAGSGSGWTTAGSGGWPTAGSGGWTTAGSGGWPTAGSGGWTTAGSGGWTSSGSGWTSQSPFGKK